MTAYLVAQIDVEDAEGYKAYTTHTPGIIQSFGGRFLIRGSEPEVREGPLPYSRLVVAAFPDMEAARACYDSPEYQKVLPHRLKNSKGVLAVYPGFEET